MPQLVAGSAFSPQLLHSTSLVLTCLFRLWDNYNILQHCYDEAMSCLKFDGLNRDERQHPMLLILNELLRIGNAPAERQRIQALGRQPKQNVRTIIGSNAIDWLTEHTYSVTVDSRTANQLVAEKFHDVSIRSICFCHLQ